MTGGPLTSKTFATISEALRFSVFHVKTDNLFGIDKVN